MDTHQEQAKGCTWGVHHLALHFGGCSRHVAPGKEEPKLDLAANPECTLDWSLSPHLLPDTCLSFILTHKEQSTAPVLAVSHF